MSGVKNLRAMFENKGDTSPPDRGRSPAVSTPNALVRDPSGTGSPRPLSTVRTNFVAVHEKDGRMGLRRHPSDESSISRRRLSNDTESTSASIFPEKPIMGSLEDATRPARKPFVAEPIPESPRQLPDANEKLFSDVGAVSDRPSINPDHHIDEEQSTPVLLPADAPQRTQTPKSTKDAPSTTTGLNGKPKLEKAKDTARSAVTAAKAPVSTVKKALGKPSSISTKSTTHPPAKSPATTAPRKTEARPPTKPSERVPPKKEASTASRTSATTTKPTSSVVKKPQPIRIGEKSDTGFIKPKPKSPTKPVNLPSSLMAPTASSVSKGSAPPRQTVSRQSAHLNAPGRAPSRAAATTAKTIKRQPSNINHPRPSVGPPPKKLAQQESAAAKRPSNVDEGFLTRMMRPTQASSSKLSEKAPLTPPRRTTQRSSTSERSASSRRESSTMRLGTQSPAPRPVETSTPLPSAHVPIIEVAAETAAVETAEEATALAEKAELVQTPIAPSPELPTAPVQETAAVETAEEVVELAEKADLVQTPVEPTEPEPMLEPEAGSEAEPATELVEDVVPEIAKVETAEQSIELAQDADLVVPKSDMVPAADEPIVHAPAAVDATPETATTEAALEGKPADETAERIDGDSHTDVPHVVGKRSEAAPTAPIAAVDEKQHVSRSNAPHAEEDEEEEL